MACPICEKPVHEEYKPFCSKRCADVDLAKWLGGSYAIPSNNPDEIDELMEALEKAANAASDDETPPRLS